MKDVHPPRKKEGDSVTTRGRKPPENPHVKVLHLDEDYVIVDKPADVRVDGDFDFTVERLARQELAKRVGIVGGSKLRLVHQLDYATSGILVLALSRKAAAFACKQFEQRTVKKTYLALVYGTMPAGTYHYDGDIAEDTKDSFKMTVGTADNPGRRADTYCTPVAYGLFNSKPVTKVKLEPSSGRRHQLRVHLLHAGFPIVGDATYAEDSDGGPNDPNTPPRMMLHAWRLLIELPAPVGLKQFETVDPFLDFLSPRSPRVPSKVGTGNVLVLNRP
mmetsp:Transcript_11558/g.35334  ORF Transcript_11558/g.35334 Transcript_11558/m.35334 type:complete len:275 (-) Transcript_11558:136-960(-)|eukprot:CAMPEP_0198732226 /NCGR_PEP_ID=MMETSP1475-20131203/34511_1 /TAXON_ID= ORGANISM="Unidentified sp., Strain CCMP1999" /NCGR_SAMPLE_ID=MMETSP1475 /ASSEMBLY_ACC=CAM_ASM_001111 /LENGTH=274 /DNA_ID=CAMNT_0044495293 /DNA_START=188 /DNA_END=1012 /DNA_ORIENTATION=-